MCGEWCHQGADYRLRAEFEVWEKSKIMKVQSCEDGLLHDLVLLNLQSCKEWLLQVLRYIVQGSRFM